jgi:cell division protein FtsB
VITQELWLIAMSIAAPIAGVVGFAVQLRQVKKTRLENDKLQLEIAALRQRENDADRRIVIATTAEVEKYNREELRFSVAAPSGRASSSAPPSFLGNLIIFTIIGLFIVYFIYDIYRIASWILGLF